MLPLSSKSFILLDLLLMILYHSSLYMLYTTYIVDIDIYGTTNALDRQRYINSYAALSDLVLFLQLLRYHT